MFLAGGLQLLEGAVDGGAQVAQFLGMGGDRISIPLLRCGDQQLLDGLDLLLEGVDQLLVAVDGLLEWLEDLRSLLDQLRSLALEILAVLALLAGGFRGGRLLGTPAEALQEIVVGSLEDPSDSLVEDDQAGAGIS